RALTALTIGAAIATTGCSGSGAQGNVLMPAGSLGGAASLAGAGNTVVKIYVPVGSQVNSVTNRAPALPTPPAPGTGTGIGAGTGVTVSPPPVSTPPPAPGSQSLSINVTGPTTISQVVSVGPNSSGCTPGVGGSTCQLALSLPAGTYAGTVGGAAIAFTVAPGSNNALNLTLGGTASQIAIVPASPMSAQNAQGGIDLLGAGRHPLLVEMLDANNNVMVGGGATYSLGQAGGSLPVTISQSPIGPNCYYVSAAAASNGSTAMLRATANSLSGTTRIDVRQLLAVANSGASTVSLYVNGQPLPLAVVQSAVTSPQALVFDNAGDLFVANQPGTVTIYAPPYNQSAATIANGINHPQSLAVDAHGDLFVANGNGSNTVTIYSPPYGGAPAATIATGVDDPVNLGLDSSGNLFVVNAAANTVTEYAPPYTGTPTTISKGLNTPSSLALDGHGNLFVANLNSTPSSVVEYSPPFSSSSAPIAVVTNGVNEQGSIALISSNLFVPNQGANTVTEYAAPYTGNPTTIVGGQSQPVALAIDSAGNLYVANYGNNTVTEYAPPYAPGAWATISTGINAPLSLALSPATSGGPTLLP
ncbi:MAG TPA: hypothetical protein VEW74_05280, partial [Candidatus Nitrosotalea sp.]|nr:hypothetical protein [Candidatus Nitrosotalea sp.]